MASLNPRWLTEMQAPVNTPSSLPSYPTMPPMSGTTADTRPGDVSHRGQVPPVHPASRPSTRPSTSPSHAQSLNLSLADAAVHQGSSPQQSLPVGGAAVNLPLRVQYLESLCVTLQKEKRGMEEEFGRQRKKFMNHMVEVEAEATLTKKTLEKLSNEVRELSTQLLIRDEEVKNISMAAQLAEAGNREAFDADRVKYEEELASLRQILKDQSMEHQAHVQGQEKQPWGGAGPEPSLTPRPSLSSPDPSDTLETSMMKAAADTRVLRSVVVPLEEEIDMLKIQLKEAQQRLQHYEGKPAANSEVSLIDFDASLTAVDTPPSQPSQVLSPSPTEGNKLMLLHQLELERAARHDLEMHTEQLESQKAMLQEEMSALQRQLEQVRTGLERERLENVELKKTWELANQHFIVAQDKLQQQVYHLEQRVSYGSTPSPSHEAGRDSTDGPTPLLEARLRSQSSDTIDVTASLGATASLGKAASWSSLQPPGGVAGGEANEELQKKVSTLEEELSRIRQEHSRSAAMCVSYESQLQRVQEQMVADLEDKDRTVDRLRAEMDKYKAGITRERQLRQSLRRLLDETREEMKTRIDTFQSHEHRMVQSMKGLRESFTEAKHDAQREVARFSDERIRLYQQIETTKEEYDCLKTLQTQQMNEYRQQLEESQRLRRESDQSVVVTIGELDTLRGKMVEAEDQLSGQVVLLREQLASEQLEKGRLQASLSAQLEAAQKKTAELQTLQETLDREQAAKEEVLLSKASIQEKSKVFIQEQQQKLEQLSWEKGTMAQQVAELQRQVTDLLRQVASLKSQLNHTEATQKDFVELSQSLQIQLAQIEEQRQLELSASQEAAPT